MSDDESMPSEREWLEGAHRDARGDDELDAASPVYADRDDIAAILMARWGVDDADQDGYDAACRDFDAITRTEFRIVHASALTDLATALATAKGERDAEFEAAREHWKELLAQAEGERDAAVAKNELLAEMVELLTESERASLGFLDAHGWHVDARLIERGREIREALATLEAPHA